VWEYDTIGYYAKEAIKEIRKMKGSPRPMPPRKCNWIYCDANHGKISWCNQVS
jgi:hypothetical protein